MTKATALTGKVKFTNLNTTKYRVETLFNGKRSRWQQTFDTLEKALANVEGQRKEWTSEATYLVTEITTRTIGVFE